MPPYYPDTPLVRDDWGRHYDVISAMDARVGPIVQQLKEDGLWDETIVVFWHAVIVLDELDEAARPALETMRAARRLRPGLEQKAKYTVRVANRAINELEGTSEIVD